MNYGSLTQTISDELQELVDLINNPEVDPSIRQRSFEVLFREVGEAVYEMVYDMAAFDFEIPHTKGLGISDNYIGLAKNVSDSVTVGGKDKARARVQLWLDDVIGKAEYDASSTAWQSGKHPTLRRIEPGNPKTGEPCCPWCEMHKGVFIEPTPEAFRRHTNCYAKIYVSGYKTRNGLLENYKKPKDR